jgi:hypothetical protein
VRFTVRPQGFQMFQAFFWAGIALSVQRLTTGWMVRGSNPGGGEVFRTRPDRPWGPLSLLYNGYGVTVPGVLRPRRGVDHTTPHLAPRLKKEYSYTCTPPLDLHGLFEVDLYIYQFCFQTLAASYSFGTLGLLPGE